jgi:hypothetical protein
MSSSAIAYPMGGALICGASAEATARIAGTGALADMVRHFRGQGCAEFCRIRSNLPATQ